MRKREAIRHVVSRVAPLLGDLYVVDLWDADLCAIGFALHSRPGYLVYVSCFGKKGRRYYVETENGEDDRVVLDSITAEEVIALLPQPSPNLRRKKRARGQHSDSPAPKKP
jgi:hypothetical protein